MKVYLELRAYLLIQSQARSREILQTKSIVKGNSQRGGAREREVWGERERERKRGETELSRRLGQVTSERDFW